MTSPSFTDIATYIQDILQRMGFSVTIREQTPGESSQSPLLFAIEASDEDSHLLIGVHGANLEALQRILRILVRRHFSCDMPFSLDINGYWASKSSSLLEEVSAAATLVARNRSAHILRPMTSYERRLVHTALADDPAVTTESIGTGSERKVVIKPASIIE